MSGSHLLLAGIIYLIYVVIMIGSGDMQRREKSCQTKCSASPAFISVLSIGGVGGGGIPSGSSCVGGGGGGVDGMTVPVFDIQLCDFSTAETELHESWKSNWQTDSHFRWAWCCSLQLCD